MSYIDKVGPSIKPKFRARWRDPSGKQRAKTFDRRAEAVAFSVKIDAAKNAGTYVDPKRGKASCATRRETGSPAEMFDRQQRPETATSGR